MKPHVGRTGARGRGEKGRREEKSSLGGSGLAYSTQPAGVPITTFLLHRDSQSFIGASLHFQATFCSIGLAAPAAGGRKMVLQWGKQTGAELQPVAGFVDDAVPICYVNGKRYELPPGRGEGTLLQFLRGAWVTD